MTEQNRLEQAEAERDAAAAAVQALEDQLRLQSRQLGRVDGDIEKGDADVDTLTALFGRRLAIEQAQKVLEHKRAQAETQLGLRKLDVQTMTGNVNAVRNFITRMHERLGPDGYHAQRMGDARRQLALAEAGRAQDEGELERAYQDLARLVGAEIAQAARAQYAG